MESAKAGPQQACSEYFISGIPGKSYPDLLLLFEELLQHNKDSTTHVLRDELSADECKSGRHALTSKAAEVLQLDPEQAEQLGLTFKLW
jgi:hypothetical protein